MANEIKLKIKVDDDGSLSIVGKEAKAAADELDGVSKAGNKMGKSSKDADRNLKGLSRQSANTTKNFSKMAQGITGGLVPAYAVLAANVFAISAAVNFFREAADFSNSIGLELHFGHGITFDSVGELSKIKEVKEFNIGHFIISESVFLGLEKSISKFRELIKKGREIQ